jgi:hypothetical protein
MFDSDELLISPRELSARHLFAIEPPELLFHYTSIGGAYGMLTSDAMWMTKIRYLNDTSELEIGIATLRDMLEKRTREPAPADETELLAQVHHALGSFSASNVCVTSFCEHGDLLSQWRWYGEGGRGVSVGVASRVLLGAAGGNINLWKCVYDERGHRELLNSLVEYFLAEYRSEKRADDGRLSTERAHILVERFLASFLQIAPIIKNPHFAEEREWRVVSVPVDPDDESYGVDLIGDERIIQRYEFKFPRDPDGWCRAVGRLVVGPTKDPELIGEAIAVLCRKNKFDCTSITYSRIPFRSR